MIKYSIKAVLILAIVLSGLLAHAETKKEYQNRFRLMLDYAVRTNEYVHQRLGDKGLASYAHAMAELLPQSRQELAFLTGEYISARYGALSYNSDELERLRESWRRLRQQDLKHLKPGPAKAAEGDAHGQSS